MKKIFFSIALLLAANISAAWEDADMRQLMQRINNARTQEDFNAALADLYKTHGNPFISKKGLTFLSNALNQWKNNGFDAASFLTYLTFVEQQTPPCPECVECPPTVECPECAPAPICPTCATCPETTPTAQPEPTPSSIPVISPTEPAPQTEIAPVETPTQPVAPQTEPALSSTPLDTPAASVVPETEPVQTPAPEEAPAPLEAPQPVTPEAMVADLVAQVEQTANLIQAAAQDSSVAEKISEEQLKYLRLALAKAMRALKKSKETV